MRTWKQLALEHGHRDAVFGEIRSERRTGGAAADDAYIEVYFGLRHDYCVCNAYAAADARAYASLTKPVVELAFDENSVGFAAAAGFVTVLRAFLSSVV